MEKLVEAAKERVEIPRHMKTKLARTLFFEWQADETEGVFRLEFYIGGYWFPILFLFDIRIWTGEGVPRWSASQETYTNVSRIRVTKENGDRYEYSHNPAHPVTLSGKGVL